MTLDVFENKYRYCGYELRVFNGTVCFSEEKRQIMEKIWSTSKDLLSTQYVSKSNSKNKNELHITWHA